MGDQSERPPAVQSDTQPFDLSFGLRLVDPVRLRVALPQCFKPEQGRTTHPSNPVLVEARCPVPLRLEPTTGTLSPWALLPVGDPVVVCLVRSTYRVSVHPLPLLIAGCVLPEDHGGEAQTPVRQESGYQRLSRRCRSHPLELEFKQSSLTHAWPNLRTSIDPLTLGLTPLHPHAIVPSLLSDEGKRIVLPAFFQRGRDAPDKTRQTLATAHR